MRKRGFHVISRARAKGANARVGSALTTVVKPQARDRWIGSSAAAYTPERIEQVLASASGGSLVGQWELFDLMEATWPRLAKNLNELKRAVIAMDWSVQAWANKGEEATPVAEEKAAFIDDAIWAMQPNTKRNQNDFEDTLRDIMDAWGKGLSVLEIDYKVSPEGIVPNNTRWIPPLYYGYPALEDELMLDASQQGVQATGGGSETGGNWASFPDHKFVVASSKAKTGHPTRCALLQPLAFWWAAANFTQEWFLNFVQLFGVPFRWANYDRNASKELIQDLCDMLENMGSAGWGAFPDGTAIDFKESGSKGEHNPHTVLLDRCDTLCDILILGQTLTTDAGDRGTQALGTVHQSVRSDVQEAAAAFVTRTLNTQFIPALIELNWGNRDELPWLMPQGEEVKDSKGMAERDKALVEMGMKLPTAWLHERHEVPEPQDGEDTLGGPVDSAQAPQPPEDASRPPDESEGEAVTASAKAATDKLVDNVIEGLTGVEARWLAGIRPEFERLVAAALDDAVSDEDFIRVLEGASGAFPELTKRLDHKAVEDALNDAMGAAAVNGAVKGALERGGRAA